MDYTRYCALEFNNIVLDSAIEGYMTINVDGRGLLRREIKTVKIPGRAGERIVDQSIPPRELKVYFFLKADRDRDFRKRLIYLHELLTSDEDARIRFGDEVGSRFGRCTDIDDPPYDSNQGIGSFMLYCQDPFLYQEAKILTGNRVIIYPLSVYSHKLEEIKIKVSSDRNGLFVRNISTGQRIILLGDFAAGDNVVMRPTDGVLTVNNKPDLPRLDYVNSAWQDFEIFGEDVIDCPEEMVFKYRERRL
ncbi:MAG: phage tail family protein [Eubacteriales bacterium]|nr:phage tail family protein [Eubacteriales bacterium]